MGDRLGILGVANFFISFLFFYTILDLARDGTDSLFPARERKREKKKEEESAFASSFDSHLVTRQRLQRYCMNSRELLDPCAEKSRALRQGWQRRAHARRPCTGSCWALCCPELELPRLL